MTRRPAAEAGLQSDVLKFSVAEILEQIISHPDRSDKEIRQAIIVYVSEGSGNADLVLQTHSRRGGDVFELPAPQIPPKLIAPKLIDEINVEPAVAVHISNGHAIAMIVMGGFVVLGPVIHGVVFKTDATLVVLVGELEIVK